MRLNKPNRDQAESGQAIVLVGLMMVVLFAFTGLAIDGGGLFFLYRDAQNATDAAVLAAAYAQCVNGDVTAAALQAADENGFDNATDNIVTVRQGPSVILPAGVSLSPTVKHNLVQVQIDAEKPSYFIQVVYPGPLSVTSRSVSYCRKAVDYSKLSGMMALGNEGNCVEINISGSRTVFEGDMHSNDQISSTGSDNKFRQVESDDSVTLTDSSLVHGNKNSYDPPTMEPSAPSPEYILDEDNLDYYNVLHLEYALYRPGGEVWNAIPDGYKEHIDEDHPDMGSNGTWSPSNTTLEGLYFVEGNIKIGNKITWGPEGITLIATGTIDFNADKDDEVSYYKGIMNETDGGVQYPGLILASAHPRSDFTDLTGDKYCGNASNSIKFSGPNNNMTGIIYAPYMTIDAAASDNTFVGMLIAQSLSFSQSDMTIRVDKSLAPPRPPVVHYSE